MTLLARRPLRIAALSTAAAPELAPAPVVLVVVVPLVAELPPGFAPVVLVPSVRSMARPAAVPGGLPGVPSAGVRLPVALSTARWVAVLGGLPGEPSRGVEVLPWASVPPEASRDGVAAPVVP